MYLRDIEWDKSSPAAMTGLFIPSSGSLLQGFIYKAIGAQKHKTLIILYGYPCNEKNLDLAQVVRSHGWICLKAFQELPSIKKGFALSTWDIYGDYKNVRSLQELILKVKDDGDECFVLNTPIKKIFKPVLIFPNYFNLTNDAKVLAD